MEDQLLYLYFEGRTTEKQTKQVTEWLSDEDNMKYYLQICRVYEFLLWNESENLLSEKTPAKKKPIIRVVKELLKVAALIAFGFVLSWQLLKLKIEDPVMQEVSVPAGQNAQVILADGSKVWLNAKSSLKFPNKFSENQRTVQLEGEGFFEVQSNEKKPFIVTTSKFSVKALGTSFNVYAYKDSPLFETALLTGRVDISDLSGEKILDLKPHTKVVLNKGKLEVENIYEYDSFLWREGIIYFNAPLSEVFKELELYFDVEIKITNTKILKNNHHSVGKFRTRDGLEHIIKVLQINNDFYYKKDDECNEITIY